MRKKQKQQMNVHICYANCHRQHFYISDDTIPQGNPFKMPPDSDIFLMRDKERQRKKQVLLQNRSVIMVYATNKKSYW